MRARHTVLSMLFITWIVSFMDRMAMSVAIPYISADLQLSPLESGMILTAFYAGYAIMQIPGGILADRFGPRRVATIAMLLWSGFTALSGAVGNLTQMLVVRFLFGLGEGAFPACAFKTIAVWFPRKERATANAIMTASNPLGAALSPLAVVAIMSIWGWRTVFYGLFAFGLIVALLFWIFVRDRPSASPRVSVNELREIEAGDDTEAEKIEAPFMAILSQPNMLKFFTILLFFAFANWGFMTWLPTYLVKVRNFSMMQMGLAASLPFFAGCLGSLSGGWVSDRLFPSDRRMPIIIALLATSLLLFLSYRADSTLTLILCQTLAGFFLLFFVAAFWALPMNTIPKQSMGASAGVINMASQIAALSSPLLIGYVLEISAGDFDWVFIVFIAALLIACAVTLLLPRHVGGALR